MSNAILLNVGLVLLAIMGLLLTVRFAVRIFLGGPKELTVSRSWLVRHVAEE